MTNGKKRSGGSGPMAGDVQKIAKMKASGYEDMPYCNLPKGGKFKSPKYNDYRIFEKFTNAWARHSTANGDWIPMSGWMTVLAKV